MRKHFISFLSAGMLAAIAGAQGVIIMPDSTNSRLVSFNAFDGSVINSNVFSLAGTGTPIHAIQVGNEIWISEQIGDRVSRWGLDGTLLGQIGGGTTGGLDNIRGMAVVGNTLYVSNGGAANGSPGASSVVMFDLNGNPTGSFLTTGTSPSPFGILEHQGGLLVSSSSANDDIHSYSLTGTSLGTFHNSASLAFTQQMTHATNGDILAANFTTGGITRHDPNTGALLSAFTASGARGVFQLGNGNIMWTNSAGAHVFDVTTGGSTQVYTGGGRYLQLANPVPEPATLAALGLGLAAVARRRKRR